MFLLFSGSEESFSLLVSSVPSTGSRMAALVIVGPSAGQVPDGQLSFTTVPRGLLPSTPREGGSQQPTESGVPTGCGCFRKRCLSRSP